MKRLPPFLLTFVLSLIASQAQPQQAPSAALDQPFTSPEQIEDFLRTARIVKAKGTGLGITAPLKLTLDDGRTQHFGVFKSINERKMGVTQLASSTEFDFKDSWMFEVAAYELDKLLGLNMVPVTVERSYNGQKGSLQFWVDNCMMESDRLKQKLNPPDPVAWGHQIFKVRVFDNLVYNIDRNLGNLLIDPNWRVYMIDHSRAFKAVDGLKSPKDLTNFSRSMIAALQNLQEESVRARCQKYLTPGEIKTMLKRRDRIVQLYATMAGEKGQGIVYP